MPSRSRAPSRPVAAPRTPIQPKAPTQSATRSYQPQAAPAQARPMATPTASAAPTASASRPVSSAPAPVPAAPQTHAPAVQQSHAPAPVYAPQQSAGGGMLQGIATIAAGSVIGHGVSHMLFDRDRSAPAEQQQAQPQAQQAVQSAPVDERDPCMWQARDFDSCLKAASGDISQCQGLFDALQQCRRPGVYQRDF